MSGMFYNLGRMAGPHVRKAQWAWSSVTGTKEDRIKAERAAGADMANMVRQQRGKSLEPEMNERLEKIAAAVGAQAEKRYGSFKFECINGNGPEAFCLPGGYVFISSEMMGLCDDSELAFVIGHELAHIVEGHAIERFFSSLAAGTLGRTGLAKMGLKLLERAYSQDQETSADEIGVALAIAAGFQGKGAVRLLSKLEKSDQSPESIGKYFSTHPPLRDRIEHIGNICG